MLGVSEGAGGGCYYHDDNPPTADTYFHPLSYGKLFVPLTRHFSPKRSQYKPYGNTDKKRNEI